MGKQGQCGVYKLYKLSKGTRNTFTHDFKKLERDSHVVTHDYADLINLNSVINGSLYEYDEQADKLYWDKKTFKKDVVFEEEEVVVVENIEELREEYTRLSDKKPHHLWQGARLIEEIEKLKK